jgi:hypothetical protein
VGAALQLQELYSKDYHEMTGGQAETSADTIVPLVLNLVVPKSVVDVGCGIGAWLDAFSRHGIKDFRGFDAFTVPATLLRIPADRFTVTDLSKPISPDRRFDLAVSLEVAEHIPPENAQTFVDTLVGLSDVVFFSAAIPGQAPGHHLNEQWPEYWAQMFEARGYQVIDCIRAKIWHDPNVTYYYAQNCLIFVRRDRLERYPKLLAVASASPGPLSLVHPRKYLSIIEMTSWTNERLWNSFRFVLGFKIKSWIKNVTGVSARRAKAQLAEPRKRAL